MTTNAIEATPTATDAFQAVLASVNQAATAQRLSVRQTLRNTPTYFTVLTTCGATRPPGVGPESARRKNLSSRT